MENQKEQIRVLFRIFVLEESVIFEISLFESFQNLTIILQNILNNYKICDNYVIVILLF